VDIIFSLVFLLCLVLLPIGLFKPSILKPIFTKTLSRKEIGLILGGGLILSLIIVGVTAPASKQVEKTTSEAQLPESSQPQQKSSVDTLSKTAQLDRQNIVVTSQIIKKIGGKYRYFFDIRNNDTRPFSGIVKISIFNSVQNNPLAENSFTTKQPIEPELGSSVYFDAFTGPTSVHGANGLSKYKYTVTKDKQVVAEGEDEISKEFEDTTKYNF
jgi:hypothetical protein